MNIYYVYAYLRESDNTPYYIGKGKDRRAYNRSRSCPVPKDKSRIVFLAKNLTEQSALDLEVDLIRFYGRKDIGTGILRNMTNGGDGTSGYVSPWKGKHRPEAVGRKISEARKGKPLSEDHKRKIGEAGKGRTRSDETRRKIGEANKRRVWSDESRRKLSESLKRRHSKILE
jgi:hypothetical protein